MSTYAHKTVGFGVPADVREPHRYILCMVRDRGCPVRLAEVAPDMPEPQYRALIARQRWMEISGIVQREFNKRLKKINLAPGRWKAGENPVDRLLGKELCVLFWAIDKTDPQQIGQAARNWLALRPEERWWLFGMAAREDCWRQALSVALAGN